MRARATYFTALRAYAPKLTIALLIFSLLAGAFAGGADARQKGKTKQARAAAANVGVSILTPAPGSVLTGDARWRVKAFSRDGIKNVRFYIDDRVAWLEGQDPWYFGGDDGYLHSFEFADGTHRLAVVATSRKNRTARDVVAVTFSNTPVGLPVALPAAAPEPPVVPPSEPAPPVSEPAPPIGPTSEPTPTTGPTSEPTPPTGPVQPPPPPLQATAAATDFADVRVTWPQTTGAVSAQILRDGAPLETRPAAAGEYTDSMLWFSTGYDYDVRMLDAAGAVVAGYGPIAAHTPALPAAGVPVAFAGTAIWATPIPAGPALSPRNADFMAYVTAHVTNPNLTTRRYGIPIYESEANDTLFGPFSCVYTCDINRDGMVPIPAFAVPDEGTDHHMTVLSRDGQTSWDYYKPVKDTSGVWSGTSAGAIVPMSGNGIVSKTIAGANAANMASLAGLVRPEDLAQGHIDHAVTIGIPGIAGGAPACPATHNVGTTSDPNALPEGARLQLDPTVSVDALSIPAWQKTIARAMQTYGAYVRDNSGTLTVYAETSTPTIGGRRYDAWNKANVGFSTTASSQGFSANFPWNRLRVLDFRYGPDC